MQTTLNSVPAGPTAPVAFAVRSCEIGHVTADLGENVVQLGATYGVAGVKKSGPCVLAWDTADMTGRGEGGLYVACEGGWRRISTLNGIALRELTAHAYRWFAVFAEGKIRREAVSHVVNAVSGPDVFVSPEQAAEITRLLCLPDTKWSALCALARQPGR